MAKDETFPLLIVSGTWGFKRRRFIRSILKTKHADGWRVTTVQGDDAAALSGAVEAMDMFVEVPKSLVVVENPEQASLRLLEAQAAEKDPAVVLLLDIDGSIDGRTKFGQFCKKYPKWSKVFDEPKEYEFPKEAARFLVEEALRHRKKLDIKLADQIVERVGTDFGMLSFEMDKFVILANHLKTDTITSDIVSPAMAAINAAMVGPLLEALAARQKRALFRALVRIRQTSRDDPTMRICRFLGESVIKWMQAAHLAALPPDAAARELGIHPFRYEISILPAARKWGKKGTVRLVSDLAAAERAVLNGAISPWNVLVARLLAAC